jgi:hypothetical protein
MVRNIGVSFVEGEVSGRDSVGSEVALRGDAMLTVPALDRLDVTSWFAQGRAGTAVAAGLRNP